MAAQQLRLLLWKDYLVRKRKLITLGGIIWATAVVLSLYIVRTNVNNVDHSTCQYAARALPSAGVLNFLQSFICTVNNECRPMEEYEEIPTFENSTLTKLQRQFTPLIYNDSVLNVAATVPDALKLLSTLADVVDEPTFVSINKYGLKVKDLFSNPARVKRYITTKLNISQDVAESVMRSELSFQGVIKGNIDRCSEESMVETLKIENVEHLNIIVKKLCLLSTKDIRKILLDLIFEVNFSKYINMIGDMYKKLSGDDRLTQLGHMLTAVLRMTNIHSFVPPELMMLFKGQEDFSYFNLTFVTKLMDQFKPTFGDTKSYKSLRELIDSAIVGVQYLNKFLSNKYGSQTVEDLSSLVLTHVGNKLGNVQDFKSVSDEFSNAVKMFDGMANNSGVDAFDVLSKLANLIYKWIPDDKRHEVLFYSTLFTKLIEGAHKVVIINMHIEEIAYNVTLRNSEGFKILLDIPVIILGKGLDALADGERAQIFTSKINLPGQMFCDKNKLQRLFVVSSADANMLKSKLCSDVWKNYFTDLVTSFGYFDVKSNINDMASLLIQETLGKDTSSQIYTIDKDFKVLQDFYKTLSIFNLEDKPSIDWKTLFNGTKHAAVMKMFDAKSNLSKQILITVHGALAKEIIKQNTILDFKITPTLIDATTMVTAMNDQLDTTPKELAMLVKEKYADILKTVLMTALDEEKTFKSLSTPSENMLCHGVEKASTYISMPETDTRRLVIAMCNMSSAIERGLLKNSLIGKAIENITNSSHGPMDEVNWTQLIDGVKKLYVNLETDYTYLFEFKTYGMDKEELKDVASLLEKAKEFWFGRDNLQRSLHLSLKFGFRLLDLMDRELFNLTGEGWTTVKRSFDIMTGPLAVTEEFVRVISALSRNESYSSDLPPSTLRVIRQLIPNLPYLMADAASILANDDTEVEPIIASMNAEPPWPCSSSLTNILDLTESSKEAVAALETVLCLDRGFQQEWVDYLREKNLTRLDMKTWNTTSQHIFLKFSSTFDSLIKDTAALKKVLEEIANDTSAISERPMTFVAAWRFAQHTLEGKDAAIRGFFMKLDKVLNSINTPEAHDSLSLNGLWEGYLKCTNNTYIDDDCKTLFRSTWKNSLRFLSVLVGNMADDLHTYFFEVNEPNSNVLQVIGFTKTTGLYLLYNKMTDFIGVLLNSYWDYGFMNQIRRASQSQFWDCEAVVTSLVPPPGSIIDADSIRKVQPYICPSLLHWISLPRGENTLLDVVARPQYYFYTANVTNLMSNYRNAFEKVEKLTALLKNISSKNDTAISEDDLKLKTIQGKFEKIINTILTYTLNKTGVSYRLFNEINVKQIAATAYLARIVAGINKLQTDMDNLKLNDISKDLSEDDIKTLGKDLITIQKIFKKRSTEAIALHFDLITNLVWQNDDHYTITNGIMTMCEDLKQNDTRKDILVDTQRTKVLLCSKNYQAVYGAVENTITDDFEVYRKSLYNLLNIILPLDELDNMTSVSVLFKNRKQIINYWKHTIQHSYDLGIPLYLKYLQSSLEHQNVILSFISGDDWWKTLRELYNGPYATKFLDSLENSFVIVEDVFTNLDKIHFVRLLRDINVNNTDVLCLPNITLSDYIPDRTGIMSDLKTQLCMEEKTELFKELPLLVFASQGYDNQLKLSSDIDYVSLNNDIENVESKVDFVKDGPQTPQQPEWVTEEKLANLRKVATNLFSQETMTKVAFGFLINVVDAGTLFLNSSQCTLCSQFTTWFKQLDLQLFKKQEYDNLLCHLHEMTMDSIYQTLKTDFHWDMVFMELMSIRNYTKYELNKAVNVFLSHVELHLLDDLSSHSPKLSDCLARNVSRNAFGNATLFTKVLAQTLKLLRSQLPHLKEIQGISDTPFIKQLQAAVAHRLDVKEPLKKYLKENNEFAKELQEMSHGIAVDDIVVNLKAIKQCKQLHKCVNFNDQNVDGCYKSNCSGTIDVIKNNLNFTLIEKELPKLQLDKFWHFDFIANIVMHVEQLLDHVARLLGVASGMDVQELMEGRLSAMLDFVMRLLNAETLDSVVYSLHSIIHELHPILEDSPLEADIEFLTQGLKIMQDFKDNLLDKDELKVEISELFSSADSVESGLSALGINNTNFWSIAAPRVNAGYINLKPILTPKSDYRVSSFVCQMENMSKVIIPAEVDVVTFEDVYVAIIEQFCNLSDEQAKQIVPVLMENINFGYVMNKVSSVLLSKLYTASNLTEAEGATVLESYPKMAALMPIIQDNVGDLSETLVKEPLFQSLANFTSVGNLISSSSFLAAAGNMLCGKPMQGVDNRFYKAIAETVDYSREPDPLQLKVLPTDFCKTLYKDIINMYGGKIVWSYIKPLIMGRILYTPSNPTVEKIIEQANSTYAHMRKLTNLVHSFAHAFSSVDKLSKHRDGIDVLRRLITSPALSQLKDSLVGDATVPDVDIEGLFDEFGDLKNVGGMLNKASDLLHCINMDRFHATRDEQELAHEAVRLTRVNEFSAGLVFKNAEEQKGRPMNVEYAIRMDIESVPTTTRIRNQFWTPGPEDSFLENMRYFRGFVQIQDLIDSAIIQLAANSSRSIQKRDTNAGTLQKNEKWAVYTQQTPYPCYRKDYFQSSLYESQALVVAFFFSLLFTVASAVRFIVSDKESGNTMLMSVMGVNLSCHTFSWFVTSLIELVLTVACVTVALTAGGVLPRTDVTLLFALLCVFGFSVLMFCYMISKLFTGASAAAVTAALAYLVTFMPYVLILSLEALLSLPTRLLACLSMSTAFSYCLLFVARLEAVGSGAHWGHLWASEVGDGMSMGLAAVMMIVDGLLYLALGCLLDRYFGIKTISSNITYTTSSGEKAGVSIVNVTKIYGERSRRPKLALDNVSIELHKGEITTLLGHNGAGKTTLINILTGMLKPTKGHITIRSELQSPARLGVCPQRDVLFPTLSAREHITLYAQLKTGKGLQEVRDEVESMLDVLSLGPHADHPANKLSGGTRRRLCVSLAFVGRPDLVSLDEPAAGVDPAARRDIWSMILKLKEERTVLLTTHHLDEAEFLSDQVVIMHKGQIHTMGSPIEIKRSLGNGYKLTVTYPHEEEWGDEEEEERTKRLLTAVRGVVRNAQIVEVEWPEVEIVLPFFDANGLNNDFHGTCLALEARQEELGLETFAMDCSSLEQVFFSITSRADAPQEYGTTSSSDSGETPSKSGSSSSIKTDRVPLVDTDGALKGTAWTQFLALIHVRYLHYIRNRWLLFLLIVLPSLFVTIAMGFSLIRPPADNELLLRLHPDMYAGATEFLVPQPTFYSGDTDPSFTQRVMDAIRHEKQTARNWTEQDSPECKCDVRQVCNLTNAPAAPEMMLLPDADTINDWLIASQEVYIEKRYGGFSSALKNNQSNLVAWYNNKGHHALPAFVNGLNAAVLRAVAGSEANITTYSHPLKISQEQLSKSTLLQHVADAGISGMLLIGYSLVSAGAAVYLVEGRTSQQKRLQLLSGVSPGLYWGAALAWDMTIMVINIAISVCVLEAFGFPVFVARSNLPAICILLLLFGFSCGSLVHLLEKLFTDPSLANMVIFCANVFLGLAGITVLLIMDIISESEATDNARWVLHKIFMLSPQFILGDALLEIAKNTVQAQVLERFGMDTYKDPLTGDLLLYHYIAFVLVGTVLLLLNLAVEYDCFEVLVARFRSTSMPPSSELEAEEVTDERRRVAGAVAAARARVVRLPTIGNINAGFVDTEGKKNSVKRMVSTTSDVAQCVALGKQYHTLSGPRAAVRALTLGIPPGQCTALLGENGAGKSTTFAMLTGEVRPTTGQIYLNDEPVTARQLCSGFISYCPQSDALDFLLTVRETLAFYCRLRSIEQEDEVIKRTLEMFELSKYSSVRCGALSGGNRRKLCCAVALAGRAPLVLLDEPTSGMDPSSRACVSRGVRAAAAARRGVLLSTHALRDARRLAARVALLRRGALCALAPVADCLTRFGGGYAVWCRAGRGGAARAAARDAWARVSSRAPHAALRELSRGRLQFVVPKLTGDKEETTKLSDIFRLMAELQSECDVEDYTINQSSLEEMFLSFSDKPEMTFEQSLPASRRGSDQLDSVTSL